MPVTALQIDLTPLHLPDCEPPMTLIPKLIVTVTCGLSCCAAALAQETPPPVLPDFPPDAETCFGRVYDKAHLTKHQKQKVTAIYLYRSLTADTEDEAVPQSRAELAAGNIEWERTTRAEGVVFDGALPGLSSLDVLVKFKDRPEMFKQSVECRKSTGDGFTCGVDCDGGGFSASRDGSALVVRQDANSSGLRVQSGCNSGDESAPEVRIDPEDDAENFRLEQMQISACHAARDAARPEWVTAGSRPLRERFTATAGLCFVPKASIAEATDQRIGALTLLTLDQAEAGEDDERPMLKVEINATIEGGSTVKKTLECAGANYAFDCLFGGNGFRLTRSGTAGLALGEMSYEGTGIADLLDLNDGERFEPIVLEEAGGRLCK